MKNRGPRLVRDSAPAPVVEEASVVRSATVVQEAQRKPDVESEVDEDLLNDVLK